MMPADDQRHADMVVASCAMSLVVACVHRIGLEKDWSSSVELEERIQIAVSAAMVRFLHTVNDE